MEVYYWNRLSAAQQKKLLTTTGQKPPASVTARVRRILKQVKRGGDTALHRLNAQIDGIRGGSLLVTQGEIAEAAHELSAEMCRAIHHAIRNVSKVHKAEMSQLRTQQVEVEKGVVVSHRYTPLSSVGIYVPRGRGSFPSMFIMLAVPAQIAGVPAITMVTPPNTDGSIDAACRYVAHLLKIDTIYRVGGAQAIAALAYGTQSIHAVDKIVGPGSVYVNSAKALLSGQVDTGMPAGPSESVILADELADPVVTALDLMIEAEHGSDSFALLLTNDQALAHKVSVEIEQRLPEVPEPRQQFVRHSLARGGIVVTSTLQEAVSIINTLAPEHLKIDTGNAVALARDIQAAGEILIGAESSFSLANYVVGANAVLPTGGAARTWSGASVRDFCIRRASIHITKEGYQALNQDAITLAQYEQFFCHAHALLKRGLP